MGGRCGETIGIGGFSFLHRGSALSSSCEVKTKLAVEEQVPSMQGRPCRVCVHGRFDYCRTFRDICRCVSVSWVLTRLLMFAEPQQGWEELGLVGDSGPGRKDRELRMSVSVCFSWWQ